MRLTQSILLGCIALSISGCGLLIPWKTHQGPKITQKEVSHIVKRVTSKNDILNMFGKPMNIAREADGKEIYLYEQVKQTMIGFSVKNEVTRLRVIIGANDKVIIILMMICFIMDPIIKQQLTLTLLLLME